VLVSSLAPGTGRFVYRTWPEPGPTSASPETLRTASLGAIPLGLFLTDQVHPSAPHGGLRNDGQEQPPGTRRPADRGISTLTSSEEWQRYLDFQSRFHHYSFGNVLLIAAQCTRQLGWQASTPGGSSIASSARVRRPSGFSPPWSTRNADAEDGENDRVIRGFKFVPVFDIAQTDGEELPSICNRLEGDDPKVATPSS